MSIFLGAVKGLNAKNLINMGIVRKEKNDSRISIINEHGIYLVRGFKKDNYFSEAFERFADAKSFFNKMYKTF